MYIPETHLEYSQRIGLPRVGRCRIELGSGNHKRPIWYCGTHQYGFNDRPHSIGLTYMLSDRCPMSRLEEWRQRKWDTASPS